MFFQTLMLSAMLEMGGMMGGIYNYDLQTSPFEVPLYANLTAKIENKYGFIEGQYINYFALKTFTSYVPFQMTFVFSTGIKITDNFILGYEHSCYHPFQTYMLVSDKEFKPHYEGAYDKFFIRFTTK